jgi:hypothetical protein
MSEVIPWPFPLPEHFLDALGYARAVAAFESSAMRARVAELLRQQGVESPMAPPAGPRPWVTLYWEPAGDELAFADGAHSGAGQLQHWAWRDYLHGRSHFGPIYGWLVEHEINLGSSDGSATHALVVDAESNIAWVAPITLAHRIVRQRSLDQGTAP